MTSSILHRASMKCPHCQATNSVTTNTLLPESLVVCSNCHTEIGRWGDLMSSDDDRKARKPYGV